MMMTKWKWWWQSENDDDKVKMMMMKWKWWWQSERNDDDEVKIDDDEVIKLMMTERNNIAKWKEKSQCNEKIENKGIIWQSGEKSDEY